MAAQAQRERLHDEQRLRSRPHPVEGHQRQKDVRGVVPEEVEAHDRDKGSLEPAEQPEALVEDPEVEARLLKSVEPGQRQLAKVVGIQEHRQDDEYPSAELLPRSALCPATDTRVWGMFLERAPPQVRLLDAFHSPPFSRRRRPGFYRIRRNFRLPT